MGVDIRASFGKSSGFEEKLGPSKTHTGGPKLFFCGKEVPVLVVPTPKVSMISKILSEILNRLDYLYCFSGINMEIQKFLSYLLMPTTQDSNSRS